MKATISDNDQEEGFTKNIGVRFMPQMWIDRVRIETLNPALGFHKGKGEHNIEANGLSLHSKQNVDQKRKSFVSVS